MKARLMAAVILLPLLLIVLLVLPSICTVILVGAVCAVASYELLHGTGLVPETRLNIYTALFAFLMSIWGYFGMNYAAALLGVLCFTGLIFMEMLMSHAKLDFKKAAVCFAGGLLIPFLISALARIRATNNGVFHVLIPFLLAFMADSGAYFAGRYLGRHKLAPIISPKKTVEGFVGGIVSAIVGMQLFCLILDLAFGFRVSYLNALAYGIFGSLSAVFGDLVFSVIKRQTGIKDYGNIIPGHGGVLDRFDSMVMVAPITEVLLLLLPVAVR